MSFVATRVFKGCGSLLYPALKASSSVAGATKKPAAKTKANSKTKSDSPANSKTKSDSPAKKTKNPTPRTTGIFKATPVSPALSQFLGTGETTRNDAVKEIWNYIKSHNLQNPDDKKEIICDEKLKQIFEGKDRVGFSGDFEALVSAFHQKALMLFYSQVIFCQYL